ncbi:DgyrCDS11813 [Dimorphilus gyrociliatus]|uniref:DgyrCDS11813 n=1 Tax=Dimorphilus gyrociliatus TaxID=2664684 RepID=A0A7I8W734_9ANNE|nr:DgyrCDS11813 [Dimorphilus gyrociliatus]
MINSANDKEQIGNILITHRMNFGQCNARKASKIVTITSGCPPTKHIRLVSKKYELLTPAQRYLRESEKMSDGELVRSMSKDEMADYQMGYYNYNKYGCPWRIFYSIGFRPKFDIYENNERVKRYDGDFTIFETRGLKLYRYNKKAKDVGCKKPAQNWREMLRINSNPEEAWNRSNYESCFKSNEQEFDSKQLNEEYEILNSSSDNYIDLNAFNGILLFDVYGLDKRETSCYLKTSFAIEVYGAPVRSNLTPLAVSSGVLGGGFLVVYACFMLTSKRKLDKIKEQALNETLQCKIFKIIIKYV